MKDRARKRWMTLSLVLLSLVLMTTLGCRIEQTEEGELPDISIEGGKLPEYDVDLPEVDVKMKETTVKVPDIDVRMPRENEPEPPRQR